MTTQTEYHSLRRQHRTSSTLRSGWGLKKWPTPLQNVAHLGSGTNHHGNISGKTVTPLMPFRSNGIHQPKQKKRKPKGILRADARIRTADPFITTEVLYSTVRGCGHKSAPRFDHLGILFAFP